MQKPSIQTLQDFYERHPYPPPVEDLTRYAETWRDQERRRGEAFLYWPFESYCEDRKILVAGCGTSQAAKYALRWPMTTIVGIDLSNTSIERSRALKRKHKLDNLTLHQMEIDKVSKLGCNFDLIVSTGVLHHLPEPSLGLHALRNCLKPHGVIHLMVYAPYGRAGIYMLQEYCRRLALGNSEQDIAELMESLKGLPPNHPIIPLLREAVDFRDPSAIADALLHPQDRAYSVDELFSLIEDCGLHFGRWIFQAPYLPACGGITQIPHNDRLRALSNQEQYAAMELFRGNMLRHSVAIYRNDNTNHAGKIDFDTEDWAEYIPVKRPDTIVVEEKLPPTAAAVLINRNHKQTDIYLPINSTQKRLFDAIDSRRTVGDLAKIADHDTARTLVQRLWQYDQIVIDASRLNANQ